MDNKQKCCYWCKHNDSCTLPERRGRMLETPPPCKDKFAWSASAESWDFKKRN